jgi:hypothetical protein
MRGCCEDELDYDVLRMGNCTDELGTTGGEQEGKRKEGNGVGSGLS